MLCTTANVYVFYGVETDSSKPYFNEDVSVLAFRSADGGFFFLCARDSHNVALQVFIACFVLFSEHFQAFCLLTAPVA